VTENAPTETALGDHPEGAIDLEVRRIASENLMTSDGMDVLKPAPREAIDGTDHAEETKV
jgi:hypothetical protein